jgi:hypothetical protein
MDWELIIKAVGAVVAAVAVMFQIANRSSKSRTRLKTDLEILQLLKPDDQTYGHVKASIDRSIDQLFREDKKGNKFFKTPFIVYSWSDFIWGIISVFVGILWTLFLIRDGFSWWTLLSGFLAFGGLGGILNGLEEPKHALDDDVASENSEEE